MVSTPQMCGIWSQGLKERRRECWIVSVSKKQYRRVTTINFKIQIMLFYIIFHIFYKECLYHGVFSSSFSVTSHNFLKSTKVFLLILLLVGTLVSVIQFRLSKYVFVTHKCMQLRNGIWRVLFFFPPAFLRTFHWREHLPVWS